MFPIYITGLHTETLYHHSVYPRKKPKEDEGTQRLLVTKKIFFHQNFSKHKFSMPDLQYAHAMQQNTLTL